ncbi:DUF551 domain-containing protein [Cronobacter dublinensis]
MSTISKERLEEKRAAALLLTEYKHEDVRLAAQENVQVIDELLALRKEREAAVPDFGQIRVGRLPTINQDDYPGLGNWWVQLRIGEDSEEILARVYGDTPHEAYSRAEALACRAAMLGAPGKQPLSVETLAGALRNAPLAPSDSQGRQRAPVEPSWIACSERMPEEGAEVYIFCDGEWVLEAQYREGDFYDVVRDGIEVFETVSRCVSHWQPRPQRPAAPGKEG